MSIEQFKELAPSLGGIEAAKRANLTPAEDMQLYAEACGISASTLRTRLLNDRQIVPFAPRFWNPILRERFGLSQ